MARSYKIHKSYHTSHHNTTKNHLQISTPPSSVQQRTDAHNLPNKHIESQASKLQASSTVRDLQQKSRCFGVSLGSYLACEVAHGEVPGSHKPQGKAHLSEPGTHQRTWRVMGRPLRETPQTLSMTRRNDGTRTSAANLTRPSVSSCPHQTPVL